MNAELMAGRYGPTGDDSAHFEEMLNQMQKQIAMEGKDDQDEHQAELMRNMMANMGVENMQQQMLMMQKQEQMAGMHPMMMDNFMQ